MPGVVLVTAIAYDTEKNLGRAYNDIMVRLLPGDHCVFLDHDAMFTHRDWYRLLLAAIEANPDAGLFAAVTNRIGNPHQIAQGAPKSHDMKEHFAFGAQCAERYGSTVKDITRGHLISGVVMCLSRETWQEIGGFKSGFYAVDNRVHQDVVHAGKRVYLLPGLYAYHWYRGDGKPRLDAPKAQLRKAH